jgi:hypothetical protein
VPGTDSVFPNSDNAAFGPVRNFVAGNAYEPNDVDRSDLDGDGDEDLVVYLSYTRAGEGGLSVLLNGGKGAFGAPQAAPGPFWASSIVAVDLDGDGDNDLAASDDSDNVTVSTNDGDGAFAYRDAYLVGEQAGQPQALTQADFDGDGDVDIATANAGAVNGRPENVSVLTNQGDGTLGNPKVFGAGVTTVDITRARMNGDRKPDVVVANFASDNVSVLLNTTR